MCRFMIERNIKRLLPPRRCSARRKQHQQVICERRQAAINIDIALLMVRQPDVRDTTGSSSAVLTQQECRPGKC